MLFISFYEEVLTHLGTKNSVGINDGFFAAIMKMFNHKLAGKAFPSDFLGHLETLLNPIEAFPPDFIRQLEEYLEGSASVTGEELLVEVSEPGATGDPEPLP